MGVLRVYELVAVTAALALALGACVRVVVQGEVALVERRGRYRRTITGVGLVWPGIERIRVVPLHRYRMHLSAVPVRTAQGVGAYVDVDLTYETVDPVRATYAVAQLHPAVEARVRGELDLLLAATDESRPDRTLAPALRERLEPLADWGLEVHDLRLRTRIAPGQWRPEPARERAGARRA
ncbi:hypothetical protein GCM10027425_00140 [Alteromonas gracilis]